MTSDQLLDRGWFRRVDIMTSDQLLDRGWFRRFDDSVEINDLWQCGRCHQIASLEWLSNQRLDTHVCISRTPAGRFLDVQEMGPGIASLPGKSEPLAFLDEDLLCEDA